VNILYELLQTRSNEQPKSKAVVGWDKSLTFGQLKSAVDRTADALIDMGVAPGQVIHIGLPDLEGWVASLATAKIGAVGVSTSEAGIGFLPRELTQWRLTSPRAAKDEIDNSSKLFFDGEWIFQNSDYQASDSSRVYEFEPDDFCRGLQTSGSTGTPKLALFTHEAITSKVHDITSIWSSGQRELNFMPLGATGGFSSALASLITGSTFYIKPANANDLVDFVALNNLEVLSGSPQQIVAFMNLASHEAFRLKSVKLVRLAGSNPGIGLISRIRILLDAKIVSVYGSTETGAIFSTAIEDPATRSQLGELRGGCDYKIVDETGVEVSVGQEGYLETKSPSMFSGYLQSGNPFAVNPAPAWFKSQDLVRSTDQGVEFVGRSAEIINVGGVKLNVSGVEEFARSINGVKDALCFSGETRFGQDLHIMAISKEPWLAIEFLLGKLNEEFGVLAPKYIWELNEIPRAGIDKPARAMIRDLFFQQPDRP
jgi:acyl-coenzyme A synthetase/AMP-(fatty) acid ligase